jgi:lycopene cyclase domain-containing protein
MTYWALNAIFLTVVAIVGVLAIIRARRSTSLLVPVLITLVLLLIVTAVFDNVMIGVGLVGYDRARISGAFIGIAPLEDFAYAVAGALLLPSLWILLEGKGDA